LALGPDEQEVRRHGEERPRRDAEHLRDDLLFGICSEKIARFEIDQQIGGVDGGAAGDGRGHEVRRQIPRRENAVDELRHLAHRRHGREIRFARRSRGHQREKKRPRHRQGAHPHGDIEKHCPEVNAEKSRNGEASPKPARRRFEIGQRVPRGVFRPFPKAANTLKRAQDGPPSP
jgi:hypothetical protein